MTYLTKPQEYTGVASTFRAVDKKAWSTRTMFALDILVPFMVKLHLDDMLSCGFVKK